LDAVRLEQHVRDLKSEKERLIEGLIEMERQIMLWEKKIQLAKETREALDPNIGAQELRSMTSEIHRMELKLGSLQKIQEKLVTEMEKCVVRRETIALRSKLRGHGYTQASLNKAIAQINKQLKTVMGDMREVDKGIHTIAETTTRVNSDVAAVIQGVESIKRRQTLLLSEAQVKLDEKAAMFTEISMLQKKGKRYTSAKDGKYQFLKTEESERSAELQKSMDRMNRIEKVISTVMVSNLLSLS
jgi:hypothetical protein